jgi:hypothetical protein
MENNIIQEVIDYANDKKGLLFIVGNPLTDEMVVSFMGRNAYVKFPTMKDKKDNILMQTLNKSAFKDGVNELLTALIKTLELSEEDGQQVYQVVAGSLQAITENNNGTKKKTVLKTSPVIGG